LYEGVPGILYALATLPSMTSGNIQSCEGMGWEEAEALSLSWLEKSGQKMGFELCYGICGLGVYFLARRNSALSARALRLILMRLESMAARTGSLVSWPLAPEVVSEDSPSNYPTPRYNLGMAHGVPAVISFLAILYKAGVERQRVRRLIEGSVMWLLGQRLPSEFISSFPEEVGTNVEPHESRLRWCYGDLPIAVCLWTAGVNLAVPEWRDIALNVFVKAAERPIEDAGTVGVSLCHGLTSVAHIFNRASQATGDERLKEASRRWFNALLASRKPGAGIGGWTYEMPGPNGKPIWRHNPGLLNGAAGVGLALLAAVSDQEPLWDRCMLLDLPPAPEKQSFS